MRIGVFVCHCGSNIGGTVDCAQVAKNALGFADVVYATDLMYTCAEPGLPVPRACTSPPSAALSNVPD